MSSGHRGGDWVSSKSAIAETARERECRTMELDVSHVPCGAIKLTYTCSFTKRCKRSSFICFLTSWVTFRHNRPSLDAIRFRNSTAASCRTYTVRDVIPHKGQTNIQPGYRMKQQFGTNREYIASSCRIGCLAEW
jgi:hypothetical protein